MGIKVTTEDFIKKAIAKHGTKYNYSKVVYKCSTEKVIIGCPVHGDVLQTPTWHINGYGCTKCGNSLKSKHKKIGKDGFIANAKSIHGDKYDYSLIEYTDCDSKVKIICGKHGEFAQSPYAHVNMKQGCPSCGKEFCYNLCKSKLLTTEEFIEKAKSRHGNRYDYSLVDYVNTATYVKIICSKHGVFKQKPSIHLVSLGCQKCALCLHS